MDTSIINICIMDTCMVIGSLVFDNMHHKSREEVFLFYDFRYFSKSNLYFIWMYNNPIFSKVLSGGFSCISSTLGHQVVLLELVANVATRWHYLQNKFVHQVFWPPGGATCIATLLRIALLTSPVGIELLSSSARVTSVKSVKGHYKSSCRS